MIDFILKYWIEFIFGLFVTGASILLKHHLKLFKQELKRERDDLVSEIKKAYEAKDEEMRKAYESKDEDLCKEISNIKAGVLSIQRPLFINKCRTLLKNDHEISLEEFEDIDHEHDVYNSLGGNHDGDKLFSLVNRKYEQTLNK